MDGRTLHDIAARTALALPAAVETQPFGEDSTVYKVVGKMFAMNAVLRGTPIVNLKVAPPHGAALVRDYAEITPGWHMNKQHWITLSPGPGLDEPLVEDLVANAYDLVVLRLPKAQRPIDPTRG